MFESVRKTVLIVLFIPSVERDGITQVDQEAWVHKALTFFGALFGGATAFPKAKGVWRDDERAGELIHDEPVILHCYVSTAALSDQNLDSLAAFCRHLGRETHQGEIGIVVDGNYIAIRDFGEST